MSQLQRALVIACLSFVTGVAGIELLRMFWHGGSCPRCRGDGPKRNACIANLKQLDAAKVTWAFEHDITNALAAPTDLDLFGENAYIRDKPECLKGGTYVLGPVKNKPTCSVPGHTL